MAPSIADSKNDTSVYFRRLPSLSRLTLDPGERRNQESLALTMPERKVELDRSPQSVVGVGDGVSRDGNFKKKNGAGVSSSNFDDDSRTV